MANGMGLLDRGPDHLIFGCRAAVRFAWLFPINRLRLRTLGFRLAGQSFGFLVTLGEFAGKIAHAGLYVMKRGMSRLMLKS